MHMYSIEQFTASAQSAFIAELATVDGLPVACHTITNIAAGSGTIQCILGLRFSIHNMRVIGSIVYVSAAAL
jgi:hypothetical protein